MPKPTPDNFVIDQLCDVWKSQEAILDEVMTSHKSIVRLHLMLIVAFVLIVLQFVSRPDYRSEIARLQKQIDQHQGLNP